MPITAAQLKRLVETFDWDAWNAKIGAVIQDGYEAVALEQAAIEATRHGLDFDADDPFVERWFTEYVGERITQIDETTRERVRDTLQAALEDGEGGTAQELAERVREAAGDAAAFSPARALTIARTETAIAVNHGAGLAYQQNGITHVEISDGDGDEECAEADGQIWTVDEFLANPIAHPNCVRSAAPVVDEDDQAAEE